MASLSLIGCLNQCSANDNHGPSVDQVAATGPFKTTGSPLPMTAPYGLSMKTRSNRDSLGTNFRKYIFTEQGFNRNV